MSLIELRILEVALTHQHYYWRERFGILVINITNKVGDGVFIIVEHNCNTKHSI